MKKIFFISIFMTVLYSQNNMETLYLKLSCNSCHGMYGEGMGSNPRLQGVKYNILYERLTNLQKGITRSTGGAIMVSFAKSLDKNQTAEMVKYISNLKTPTNIEIYDEEYQNEGDGGS